MAISSNSIIHYTDTFDKIKSILLEGFRIKYCSEKLIVNKDSKSFAAHPMISFCDIPLSQSHKHFDAYGKYGIGLNKNWAKKLGINPVLYIDEGSSISKTLGELLIERRNANSNLTVDQRNKILRIKSFTKNYSGLLKRKGIEIIDYKYYDEREWRFVPESKVLAGAKFSIHLKDYLKEKDKFNNQIADIRIKFKAHDITYIIVEKTNEIPKLIKVLKEHFLHKLTDNELDLLLSKVCSTTQIQEDY